MTDWQPTASVANLQARAEILANIRQFFASRGVLEVETPLLSHATVTDPFLASFATAYLPSPGQAPQTLYLQTSPEFAMKRLLAAGSGAIYQICKAFRNEGEVGRQHNPEFTLLEWYRPGFNHHDLMNEVDDLLQLSLQCQAAEYLSYQAAFERYLAINPHVTTAEQLKALALAQQLPELVGIVATKDTWLQLLMSEVIEPQLGQQRPCFLYDFPASQAALAKIRLTTAYPVAERFEVYFKGIELANGFHELTDAKEQRQRFEADSAWRAQQGYTVPPQDERLLAALQAGLPACAGVALGLDRLIMLALQAQHIAEVLAFPLERA